MVYVFGHITPDTDATCSAIAYAWYARTYHGKDATAFVQGSLTKETLYVLKRFGQTAPALLPTLPEAAEVVIVDTNNPEELPSTINEARIVELVDHHKLFGGLRTSEPVKITMRPVGCTCTVLWLMFREEGIGEITPEIAGIMLASILSDTLNLISPTTTDMDRQAVNALTELAQVDAQALATEMFAAKSDLTGISPEEIIVMDSKVISIPAGKVRISSLETTDPRIALSMRAELEAALIKAKQAESLAGIFLFIIDILNQESVLLIPSEREKQVAESGFGLTFSDGVLHLPGVVSRKKQILPALEHGFRTAL